jgi:hypothetical protein
LADINALATMGGQQQTIGQNQQLFPLNNLSTLSGLMRGYSVPSTTKTTAEMSPLSGLATIGAGTAGLFAGSGTNGTGPNLFSKIVDSFKGATGTSGTGFNASSLPGSMSMDDYNAAINGWIKQPDGSYTDSEGNPLEP